MTMADKGRPPNAVGRVFTLSLLKHMNVDSAALAYMIGGVDQETVRLYAKRGLAVRVAHGTFAMVDSVHGITKVLREQAAGRIGRNENVDAARANMEFKDAQRDLTRLKLKQLGGELISLGEIEEAWDEVALVIKQLFLTYPARLRADLPHLTGKDQKVMDRVARDMLSEAATEGSPVIPGQRQKKKKADNGRDSTTEQS